MIEAPSKGRKVKHEQPEFDDQVAVFQWRNLQLNVYPELKYMFSTLNGVRLPIGVAVKMKRSGMTRGVLDIWLPVRRGGYSGLVIELKHGDNDTTPEQKEWIEFLKDQGFCAVATWGVDETIGEITNYLERRG
jgi:hypothetical protein